MKQEDWTATSRQAAADCVVEKPSIKRRHQGRRFYEVPETHCDGGEEEVEEEQEDARKQTSCCDLR